MKTSTTIAPMNVSFKAFCIATVLTFLILDLLASGSALAYRNAPNAINDSGTIRELNILPDWHPATHDAGLQLCDIVNFENFWIKINHRLHFDPNSNMPSRFQKSPHTELA